MSDGDNGKMLTVSRKLVKILTVSRKSHHPIKIPPTYIRFGIFFPSIDVFPIPNPQCRKIVAAFFDVRRC